MLKCPVCDVSGPRIKVMITRAPYRQRRCTNCKHVFFTLNDEVCTKPEFYLAETMARQRRKELETAGQAPQKRKGPTPKQVDALPAKEYAPTRAVRLLATGHTVEEVPGGRIYRMKL